MPRAMLGRRRIRSALDFRTPIVAKQKAPGPDGRCKPGIVPLFTNYDDALTRIDQPNPAWARPVAPRAFSEDKP